MIAIDISTKRIMYSQHLFMTEVSYQELEGMVVEVTDEKDVKQTFEDNEVKKSGDSYRQLQKSGNS